MICHAHGNIGEVEEKYIGATEIEHRDLFGCYYPISVVNVLNAMVSDEGELPTDPKALNRYKEEFKQQEEYNDYKQLSPFWKKRD